MSANPSRIKLRPTTVADEPFCFTIYASTRAEEIAATGWSSAQRNAFLREQFATRANAYRTTFPNAQHSIVSVGSTPVGTLIVQRTAGEIRVVDLALLPARRGGGLGTQLLRALMEEACDTGRPLRLQVLKGNPALRLYLRLGFSPAGDNGLYLKLEWLAPTTGVPSELPRPA